MKHTANRVFSILLALLLMMSAFGETIAYAEEPDGANVIDVYADGDLGAGGPMQDETGIEEINCVQGEPEEVTLDNVEPDIALSLGGDEELYPEGYQSGYMDDEVQLGRQQEMIELGATPTVSSAKSSIEIVEGNTVTITFSASGFSTFFLLEYSTNNTTAYSCAWGSWSSITSIPLRITGKKPGSGRLTIYMKDASSHRVLAQTYVDVKVVSKASGKVTASPTSLSMKTGDSQTVTFTVTNLTTNASMTCSNSNSAAVSTTWQSSSGSKYPHHHGQIDRQVQ